MTPSRRHFLQSAAGTGSPRPAPRPGRRGRAADAGPARPGRRPARAAPGLAEVARQDRLDGAAPQRPDFLVRVRSTDGAEGLIVPNADRLSDVYPIFLNHVAPFFVGKDARELESLLWELYRHDSNYKFQGLALWVCVAAAEFAMLDLLGKLAGKSIGDLLGGAMRRDIAVYRASGNRGNTPEAGGRVPARSSSPRPGPRRSSSASAAG